MSTSNMFLALDLGAESGRAELVTLDGGRVSMREIRRWPNRPVMMGQTLHWDLPFLLAEIIASLHACHQQGVSLDGISVDTWGVDFGLLTDNDVLLGNPVNYRDTRTENIHEFSNPIMSTDEIFSLTGYEPWAISSLFQLLSIKRDTPRLLDNARCFLNMPDLLGFYLTGLKTSERSIANTSNLMGLDGQWCREIISRFDLPPEMFMPLVEPGVVRGELWEPVRQQCHLGAIPVISTCGHDTSAALAAVPAQGDDWAFISCGTWSILGSLVDKPVATPRCLELGFTNEYTLGGWYLARNISGLWLVQQLRRKWNRPDDQWDYIRMTKAAEDASGDESLPLFDAADPSLLAPADMEQAINALTEGKLTTRGMMIRSTLESLALEYHRRVESLAEITGHKPERLYMVGGGIHNKLLCQLTANATGITVHAGADQCTALGNALTQALATGKLSGPQDIRQVMLNSTTISVYEPADNKLWRVKRRQYGEICNL